MADCFSLPNAVELVAETRLSAEYIARLNGGEAKDYILWKAADAIEQLLEENESYRQALQYKHTRLKNLYTENRKLKAERDAAVRTMPHDCNTCSKDCDITIAHKALLTKRCDEWEWKYAKGDE